MRQIRLTRPATKTQPAGPDSPFGDPFTGPEETSGLATITHGPYLEHVPIAGLTVGTIRRRFGARYNLPADGLGFLDGGPVDDDTVVREGQVLTFMHRANAKGTGANAEGTGANAEGTGANAEGTGANAEGTGVNAKGSTGTLVIEDNSLVVTHPEGHQTRAPLGKVIPFLAPRWFGDCVWPDGVKVVREMSRGAIVVHQTAPRVHGLQWITADSPADFGPGAKYRHVRVAMPWVIVLATYRVARTGRLELTGANECFFANKPLRSVEDPLSFPALLNVSRMAASRGRPAAASLAWICTQHLDQSFRKIDDTGKRSPAALQALLRHLFVDKFNRSSELHEGASWFRETVQARVDKRLLSIETWEQATLADPMFATTVPWIPTNRTLGQIIAHITHYMELLGPGEIGAEDLARAVVNSSASEPRQKKESA